MAKKKKKRKKEKVLWLNEFRREIVDHKKHYGFVFAKVGRDVVFLRLTHSKKDGYIRLRKNPNPEDKQPAYLKPVAKRKSASKFKDAKQGWRLSEEDLALVKKYLVIPQKK